MTKSIIGLGLAGVFVFIGLQIWSSGGSNNESGQQLSDDQLKEPVLSQGRVAYIDPETGALTATSPASKEMQNVHASVNLPPVEIVAHANGMVQAKLNGRFRTPLVATIGCDGVIEMEHTEEQSESAKDCEVE